MCDVWQKVVFGKVLGQYTRANEFSGRNVRWDASQGNTAGIFEVRLMVHLPLEEAARGFVRHGDGGSGALDEVEILAIKLSG